MNSSPNRNTESNTTTSLSHQESSSDEASASSYVDPSSNDLTIWPGAALIVADCMGTGILALPNDLKVLGIFGLIFLVINLPINFYAGDILHKAASTVERRLAAKTNGFVSGAEYNSVSVQGSASSHGRSLYRN